LVKTSKAVSSKWGAIEADDPVLRSLEEARGLLAGPLALEEDLLAREALEADELGAGPLKRRAERAEKAVAVRRVEGLIALQDLEDDGAQDLVLVDELADGMV
jgi:hypothetical protein